MKPSSKLFLCVAVIVMLLTAACGAEQGATPTLSGTSVSGGSLTDTPSVDTTGTAETATSEVVDTPTSLATATEATKTTETPVIPVTGVDVVLIECQFCVDTMAHALLVLPDTATYNVASSTTSTTTSSTATNDATCATVEVTNGKQVVLCSAPEKTAITLNICTDVNRCTDFPVNLQACPLVPDKGTAQPPNKTATPGTGDLTSTSTSPSATSTPAASPSPTATP